MQSGILLLWVIVIFNILQILPLKNSFPMSLPRKTYFSAKDFSNTSKLMRKYNFSLAKMWNWRKSSETNDCVRESKLQIYNWELGNNKGKKHGKRNKYWNKE